MKRIIVQAGACRAPGLRDLLRFYLPDLLQPKLSIGKLIRARFANERKVPPVIKNERPQVYFVEACGEIEDPDSRPLNIYLDDHNLLVECVFDNIPIRDVIRQTCARLLVVAHLVLPPRIQRLRSVRSELLSRSLRCGRCRNGCTGHNQ